MSTDSFTKAQLDGFHAAAQSLKLYRRAELETDAGAALIENLYVDPLPNDHVYQTMLKPNTTFIMGRKGTGKSTVFQRAQHGLRSIQGSTSAYIDIKTVYESSQVDPVLADRLGRLENSLGDDALRKLLLYQAFIKAVIKEIREELSGTIRLSFWDRLKPTKMHSVDELFEGLDDLLHDADVEHYVNVTSMKTVATTQNRREDTERAQAASVTASLSPHSIGVGSGLEARTVDKTSASEEDEFAQILMRTFSTKDYIIRLKKLLQSVSITRLYVFVDDFSELPEPAMRLVVDTLLAPLNNWSEELVIPEGAEPCQGRFSGVSEPGRACVIDVSHFLAAAIPWLADGRVKDRAEPGRGGGAGGVLEATGPGAR